MSDTLEATLRYEGTLYHVVDHDWWATESEEDVEWVRDSWLFGNFVCDCNRSMLIQSCYEDFPLLSCGDEIELIQLLLTADWLDCPRLLYQKPIDVADSHDWVENDLVLVPSYELPRWSEGA